MYQVPHTVSREPPYLFLHRWTRSGHPVALAARLQARPWLPFSRSAPVPNSGRCSGRPLGQLSVDFCRSAFGRQPPQADVHPSARSGGKAEELCSTKVLPGSTQSGLRPAHYAIYRADVQRRWAPTALRPRRSPSRKGSLLESDHIRRRPSVGSPVWNPEPGAPVVIPWAGQFGHRPARRVAFEPGSRPALDRAHAVALWT